MNVKRHASIRSEMLYLGDNGRCLCGDHLGATGQMTGRDLSGQSLLALTPDVLAEAPESADLFRCEDCGKRPLHIHLV